MGMSPLEAHYVVWYGAKDGSSGVYDRSRTFYDIDNAVAFGLRRLELKDDARGVLRKLGMAATDHHWVSWDACDCGNGKHGADLPFAHLDYPRAQEAITGR
jgi:hypothetical protein